LSKHIPGLLIYSGALSSTYLKQIVNCLGNTVLRGNLGLAIALLRMHQIALHKPWNAVSLEDNSSLLFDAERDLSTVKGRERDVVAKDADLLDPLSSLRFRMSDI
jgi:hypothetical protein